jgi:hypothetical protein
MASRSQFPTAEQRIRRAEEVANDFGTMFHSENMQVTVLQWVMYWIWLSKNPDAQAMSFFDATDIEVS